MIKNIPIWERPSLFSVAVGLSVYASSMKMLFHFVFLIWNVCYQKCQNTVVQLKEAV